MATSPEDVLVQQVQEIDDELETGGATHETELCKSNTTFQQQIREKAGELETSQANYETKTHEHSTNCQKEQERVPGDHKEEITELQSVYAREQLRKENQSSQNLENELQDTETSPGTFLQSLVSNGPYS